MAASVAFLHQVEYEAALNEYEEEVKRRSFELHAEEILADGSVRPDSITKRNPTTEQSGAFHQREALLRRNLHRNTGAGGGAVKHKAARKSSAEIANWLSGLSPHPANAASSAVGISARNGHAVGRMALRGSGEGGGLRLRPSSTSGANSQQEEQQQQEQQQDQRHFRNQNPWMNSAAPTAARINSILVLRRSSSALLQRRSFIQRAVHVRGLMDQVLPLYAPDTIPRRSWDMIIMALVVWTAVTVPLSVSFGLPSSFGWDLAGHGITVLFVLDLMVNFRTAYYNYQGELVRDSSAIATNYLKMWFWIDLFGTIPFDSIVLWTGAIKAGGTGKDLAALGFLKAPRLLRLGRLLRFLDSFKNAKIFRIVQLFLAMILISHWLACIWYMMYRFGGSEHADAWAFEMAGADLNEGRTHDGGHGNHLSYYLVTYYYSFLLLVGDNITAYNNFERTFYVFVLIAGTFFYSAVVGQMATLVATMNVAVNRHGQKLLMVQDALRYAGVPDEHSEKVQEYFEYLQQRSHPGAEGMQFLQELPVSLHLNLCQFLHMGSLHKVSLFKDCEQGFMNALALRIRMISLSPSEVIFRVGDVGKEMYVIRKGCVAVTSPAAAMWGLLQPGEIFGEVALLSTGKRTANCTALGFVDLAVLTGPDLQVVMRDYPVSAAIIHNRAAERARSLQSKNKMWLELSADDEYYDDREPKKGDADTTAGGEGGENDTGFSRAAGAGGADGDVGSFSSLSSSSSNSTGSSSARGVDTGCGKGDGGDDDPDGGGRGSNGVETCIMSLGSVTSTDENRHVLRNPVAEPKDPSVQSKPTECVICKPNSARSGRSPALAWSDESEGGGDVSNHGPTPVAIPTAEDAVAVGTPAADGGADTGAVSEPHPMPPLKESASLTQPDDPEVRPSSAKEAAAAAADGSCSPHTVVGSTDGVQSSSSSATHAHAVHPALTGGLPLPVSTPAARVASPIGIRMASPRQVSGSGGPPWYGTGAEGSSLSRLRPTSAVPAAAATAAGTGYTSSQVTPRESVSTAADIASATENVTSATSTTADACVTPQAPRSTASPGSTGDGADGEIVWLIPLEQRAHPPSAARAASTAALEAQDEIVQDQDAGSSLAGLDVAVAVAAWLPGGSVLGSRAALAAASGAADAPSHSYRRVSEVHSPPPPPPPPPPGSVHCRPFRLQHSTSQARNQQARTIPTLSGSGSARAVGGPVHAEKGKESSNVLVHFKRFGSSRGMTPPGSSQGGADAGSDSSGGGGSSAWLMASDPVGFTRSSSVGATRTAAAAAAAVAASQAAASAAAALAAAGPTGPSSRAQTAVVMAAPSAAGFRTPGPIAEATESSASVQPLAPAALLTSSYRYRRSSAGSVVGGGAGGAGIQSSPLPRRTGALRRMSGIFFSPPSQPPTGSMVAAAAAAATAPDGSSGGTGGVSNPAAPPLSAGSSIVAVPGGASILRLARRSSGANMTLLAANANPSGGGIGGATGPMSPASRRISRSSTDPQLTPKQTSDSGNVVVVGGRELERDGEEVEWISTRMPARKFQRGSMESYTEEDLASLAPSSLASVAANMLLRRGYSEALSSRVTAIGAAGGGGGVTVHRARHGSCSGAGGGRGSQRSSAEMNRANGKTGEDELGPPSALAAGSHRASVSGGYHSRKSSSRGAALRSNTTGFSTRIWPQVAPAQPPPPPPPPPDGVFVPRAAWNKLLQAVSQLQWFENALHELTELVSAQDEALARLEARAERAAALGATGGAGSSTTVLGIIEPSMLKSAGGSRSGGGGTGRSGGGAAASSPLSTPVGTSNVNSSGLRSALSAALGMQGPPTQQRGEVQPGAPSYGPPQGVSSQRSASMTSVGPDGQMTSQVPARMRNAVRAVAATSRLRSNPPMGAANASAAASSNSGAISSAAASNSGGGAENRPRTPLTQSGSLSLSQGSVTNADSAKLNLSIRGPPAGPRGGHRRSSLQGPTPGLKSALKGSGSIGETAGVPGIPLYRDASNRGSIVF